MAIPKEIHQIWLQGWDKLPDKYKENVQSVADKNPGWHINKWDENSIKALLQQLGPQYVTKYDNFKLLHQKVDFGRYAILYVKGGVSVDIDAMAIKGFDSTPDLEKSNFIVSKNSSENFVNNATILVSQNNPLMKQLIDGINGDCSPLQPKFSCITNTTGPEMFNKFVNNNKDKITILNHTYFEPCSGRNPYCEITPDAILDHRHEGSWLSPFQKQVMTGIHVIKQYRVSIIAGLLVIVGIWLIAFSGKKSA